MDDQAQSAEPIAPEAPPATTAAAPMAATEKLCSAFALLQAELESLHQSTAEQEKRAAEVDARDAALREHAAQLSEREFHLAERHRELNAAQEQLLQDAGSWRQREEALNARERALAEREAAMQASLSAAPRGSDEFLRTRRERLKKQRRLLAERAAQLVRAKEAIASRLADTARTRTSLPLAGGAVPAQPAPTVSPRPSRTTRGSSFGVGMLTSALALAAIAGASWWVAGVVDQPRFIAQATIGMANQGSLDQPELVESWSEFHQALATDPQLLEQAAERLKRRGYEEFATPSDLRRLIDESMTIDASIPGRLNLSMLGAGRQRTQRILETYTSILVGMANDSRERRADQSSTIVMIDAKAGDEPVSDHRLPIFGMVAGAMATACILAGFAGMSLAGRARAANEKTALETEGGEERWSVN
ncbi:MAG: hypothetical protein JNK58_00400 [Phycisphaerae bacterium]|nr:hypothetical protein [Phycisphaerae bacterium]